MLLVDAVTDTAYRAVSGREAQLALAPLLLCEEPLSLPPFISHSLPSEPASFTHHVHVSTV
ncbi:uncharacterized protein FOMMEDRAFT_161175 [Fomitiporia mediterranea MF3/22]|uniref:uncharacterized protein n=1 Tax=Fomitiporia mediterranea (strain MF3/22) TaxID=694068 RepID=UPI00044082CC|nr:uncharacterized protein FOMMEDRAFT_161175 [Fomitiporia mediterranea MF3/22]EJC98965.1 hypothetical protein FOMMEDRAFT_161175 [Fomitiporia mediterranea MF3/22]